MLKQELIEYHTDLKLVVTEQKYEIYKKAYTHELEGLRKCIKDGTIERKRLEKEEKEERERKEKGERERKQKEEKERERIEMEKIINESKEFRTDNDLRKLSKSQDLSVSFRSKVKDQAHECGHRH